MSGSKQSITYLARALLVKKETVFCIECWKGFMHKPFNLYRDYPLRHAKAVSSQTETEILEIQRTKVLCFPNCKTNYEFLIRVSRQVYPPTCLLPEPRTPIVFHWKTKFLPEATLIIKTSIPPPKRKFWNSYFCIECILHFRRLIFFEICLSEHCRHFLKSSLSYNLNGSYMTAYINALSCESALRLCLISKNSGGSCLKHASTK